MKAAIDEKGVLSITPETSLESYALAQWWANYNKGNRESGMNIHIIKVDDEPVLFKGTAQEDISAGDVFELDVSTGYANKSDMGRL